jgi:hypothetical protein
MGIEGRELSSNVASPIRGGRPSKGGVKVNCSQARYYHLTFGMETFQLLIKNMIIFLLLNLY